MILTHWRVLYQQSIRHGAAAAATASAAASTATTAAAAVPVTSEIIVPTHPSPVLKLRELTDSEIEIVKKGIKQFGSHAWADIVKTYLPQWDRKLLGKAYTKYLKLQSRAFTSDELLRVHTFVTDHARAKAAGVPGTRPSPEWKKLIPHLTRPWHPITLGKVWKRMESNPTRLQRELCYAQLAVQRHAAMDTSS
jgi:hypothetical protein